METAQSAVEQVHSKHGPLKLDESCAGKMAHEVPKRFLIVPQSKHSTCEDVLSLMPGRFLDTPTSSRVTKKISKKFGSTMGIEFWTDFGMSLLFQCCDNDNTPAQAQTSLFVLSDDASVIASTVFLVALWMTIGSEKPMESSFSPTFRLSQSITFTLQRLALLSMNSSNTCLTVRKRWKPNDFPLSRNRRRQEAKNEITQNRFRLGWKKFVARSVTTFPLLLSKSF